ncbi:MAG: OsmC family protein [Bacteroidales bacterium]|nr:OsmC family protein [Bacteroidales bacterium]
MSISQVKVSSRIREGFRIDVNTSHPFVIDQPKAAGGTNQGPNPLEIFLSSLAACICTLGRIIATQKKLNVRAVDVEVEGDIDKDFLMGFTTEGRAGFTEIRTFVTIDADLTQAEKEDLLHEIERRCPIADNLALETSLKAKVVDHIAISN